VTLAPQQANASTTPAGTRLVRPTSSITRSALLANHGRNTKATVVDHIKPHNRNPNCSGIRRNWAGLCARCHADKRAFEATGKKQYSGGKIERGCTVDGSPIDPAHFDGSPLAAIVNTSDVAGNTIQSPAHGLTTNDQVRIEQFPGDTPLPAGLSENTTYFVIATGLTADVFELSATQGGAAIDITAAGRMLVMKVVAVTVNQNDAPTFAANKLALSDD
jgi:hypothetical protein